MRTSLFVLLLFFSGSILAANPVNLRTAQHYYQQGQQAEARKDYQAARIAYSRALLNAKLGEAPPAATSMLTYNLGRMEGYACNFSEAERLILDALAQEEKLSGPSSGLTSMRLLELARLNFDRGLYSQSLTYFERGVSAVEKLDIESSDPSGFALVLDDWAKALKESGEEEKAQGVLKRATSIRDRNPGKRPGFVPARYSPSC